jgi:ABC-type polar amino acid transport system ATPase subunit
VNGLLEVSDLEVAYGPSQVLFGVDLAMAEGEAATLLGRNGMGKTTTLRAICGLQAVKTGSIRFAGERIDGWRPDRIGRAGIALVPEGRQVFPNLTVASICWPFSPTGAASATRGRRPASANSSRHCGCAQETSATSSPAANSRCWRSAARWSPTRAC